MRYRRYRNNIRLKLSDMDMEIVSQMSQRAIKRFSELSPVKQRQLIEKAKKKSRKVYAKKKNIDRDKREENAKLQEQKKDKFDDTEKGDTYLKNKEVSGSSETMDLFSSDSLESNLGSTTKESSGSKSAGAGSFMMNAAAQNLEKLMESKVKADDTKKRQKKESQEAQTLESINSASKKGAGGIASGIATIVREAMIAAGESGGTLLIPILIAFAVIILLFFIFIIVIIIAIVGAVAGSDTYKANTSDAAEAYRPIVEKYCEQYEMQDFEEIILAIMMQESGGKGTDPMQSSECRYNIKYPNVPNGITDPEYSIECGIRNFKDCTEKADCTSVEYSDTLYLALQGYNFGQGYISWALEHYGGYSTSNVEAYSMMMAAQLGWSSYGDTEYVQHVLQYYVQIGGFDITNVSNEDAVNILTELKNCNDVDDERWAVICMGATRIGNTKYDMYGEDTRAGLAEPRTLDCSSFVAWSYHKAGFSDVPYYSTTDTFLTATNFEVISADELEPGDIGLNTGEVGNTGGGNHMGIYIGKDENGAPLWLHCTSGKSNSDVTPVEDGPRISYYTSFTVFYRYTGFKS